MVLCLQNSVRPFQIGVLTRVRQATLIWSEGHVSQNLSHGFLQWHNHQSLSYIKKLWHFVSGLMPRSYLLLHFSFLTHKARMTAHWCTGWKWSFVLLWVPVHVSHAARISFVWHYWSTPSFPAGLLLLPFPLSLYLCLSTLALCLIFICISRSIPLICGALVTCSDYIWCHLYNGFRALGALRGITGIPGCSPASLKVNVFFSCTLCIGVSIYRSLAVCFIWQFEALV